jgi:hypothetical protein
MLQNEMKCSERECKSRVQNVLHMDLERLEQQLDHCVGCEDGIHKSSPIAKGTTDAIGEMYALKFNQKFFNSGK